MVQVMNMNIFRGTLWCGGTVESVLLKALNLWYSGKLLHLPVADVRVEHGGGGKMFEKLLQCIALTNAKHIICEMLLNLMFYDFQTVDIV